MILAVAAELARMAEAAAAGSRDVRVHQGSFSPLAQDVPDGVKLHYLLGPFG